MPEPNTRGIDLSLEPLDDFVVIQPSDEESETNLGLIIPASAEADCRTGVVTAVGQGSLFESVDEAVAALEHGRTLAPVATDEEGA